MKDDDLRRVTRERLVDPVRKLRAGIRAHRDSRRDDLCWHLPGLWRLLPEKTDPRPEVPNWPPFLDGGIQYRKSFDAQPPDAPRFKQPHSK